MIRIKRQTYLKGSFTIEAAVIVPLILTVFAVILHLLFYYHDKNILGSVAYETASYGAGRQTVSEQELEQKFEERMRSKLLLFREVQSEVTILENEVKVTARAWKKKSSLKIESAVSKTEPEDYIRRIRKAKKIQEGIGKKE